MEPKNGVWEDDFPFNWAIFRFHINFQGCMICYSVFPTWRSDKRTPSDRYVLIKSMTRTFLKNLPG